MAFWGALGRLTGLSYTQCVCVPWLLGRGARGRVISCFWWPSLPIFSPGVHRMLLSGAEGDKLSLPKPCSAPGPLPRWLFQCSPGHAREDLDAPKSPARDQQRQPRLDFY